MIFPETAGTFEYTKQAVFTWQAKNQKFPFFFTNKHTPYLSHDNQSTFRIQEQFLLEFLHVPLYIIYNITLNTSECMLMTSL